MQYKNSFRNAGIALSILTFPLFISIDGMKQYTWSGRNSIQWDPPVGTAGTALFFNTKKKLLPYKLNNKNQSMSKNCSLITK